MLLELKMVNSPDGDINLLNNLHTLTGLQSSNIVFFFFFFFFFGLLLGFYGGFWGCCLFCFLLLLFFLLIVPRWLDRNNQWQTVLQISFILKLARAASYFHDSFRCCCRLTIHLLF